MNTENNKYSSTPEIIMILAMADNGVIGNNSKLPWHLPADLKYFKSKTRGCPMIMGRRTFESLPGILPGRQHIILTRDPNWFALGTEKASNIEDAINLADNRKIFIIGGAQIYKLFESSADKILLTQVHINAHGDTMMKKFDPSIWQESRRIYHESTDDYPAHSFITLMRKI